MLEVAIAKERLQTKKGLIQEHSKENEGNQNFKEVFSKAVVRDGSKKGEDQAQKVQNSADVEVKTLNATDRVLHSLLNGLIASTKKESDTPLAQMTLQTKLVEAKNILESKLNRSIDIKDLKDVKTLGQLITQANKKGLNLKNIKFELVEKSNEKDQSEKSSKEVKKEKTENAQNSRANAQDSRTNTQAPRITPSLVLPSILHRQGQTQELSTEVKKEQRVTLASLLSKTQTKETPQAQQTIASQSEKPQAKESKNSLLSSLLAKEEKVDEKKVATKSLGQEKRESNREKDLRTMSRTALHNPMEKEENKKSTDSNQEVSRESKENKSRFSNQRVSSESREQNSERSILQRVVERKVDEQRIVETKTQLQVEQSKEVLKSKLGTISEQERSTATTTKAENVDIRPANISPSVNMSERIFDAKATMRHFASNLREQIQEYKPPISRLTLTLNPKNLGEVDVVIRSRGDSLSVQISAATAPALQILAQNSMELRQNLQNMGFENLSMHFSSSNKEGKNQGYEQENNRKYYSEDELEDEELSAMVDQIEIQLPKYV